MSRASLVIALCLASGVTLPGCLAPPPPAECTGRLATVRASGQAEACKVAALVDDIVPKVHAELGGSVEAPIEVWVQEDLRIYGLPGAGSQAGGFYVAALGRIHVSAERVADGHGLARYVLAHELVHQLRDEAWGTLDAPLEEGLADLVAMRVAPEGAPFVRAQRLIGAVAPRGELAIVLSFSDAEPAWMSSLTYSQSEGGWLEDLLEGPDVSLREYGCAMLVMERLADTGRLPELRARCEAASGDATVTLDDAALLAELDLSETALLEQLPERFDAAALRAMVASTSEDIAAEFARRFPPDDGDPKAQFLRMDPVFRVAGEPTTVHGSDIPELLAAYVRLRTEHPVGP